MPDNLLLLIDPQADFHPGGSLAIPSANADALKISTLLSSKSSPISSLIVTLDSHHKFDIAHPGSWIETATSSPPAPFTLISNADIATSKYVPKQPTDLAWALEYTTALEAGNRFKLCIWPEHCLMGSPGHNVDADIQQGITSWLENKGEGELKEGRGGTRRDERWRMAKQNANERALRERAA